MYHASISRESLFAYGKSNGKYCRLFIINVQNLIQLPLVIVDSSVSGKLSTIMRESTITREIHAKIDILSAQSIHYNERIHY